MSTQTEHPLRERLPTTRESLVHKFNVNGYKGYLTVGLYPDGRVGEIFICMNKEGSVIGGLMDTIAILASVALQHGVSLEYLRDKFAGQRFEPSGLTTNGEIPEASSIPDYLFRWIDMELKKRKKQAHAAMEQS